MVVKVRLKEQSNRQTVEYAQPTGHRYTFFADQWVNVRDDYKEDIEFFKNTERFEVEGFMTKAKDAIKELAPKTAEAEKPKPELHEPDARNATRAKAVKPNPKEGDE